MNVAVSLREANECEQIFRACVDATELDARSIASRSEAATFMLIAIYRRRFLNSLISPFVLLS